MPERNWLPDAGTFWYHPHSNEVVQLERGLYGAIVVHGPNEPQLDAERVFVLDDVDLDRARGTCVSPSAGDRSPSSAPMAGSSTLRSR
jgi:hypothetical protein